MPKQISLCNRSPKLPSWGLPSPSLWLHIVPPFCRYLNFAPVSPTFKRKINKMWHMCMHAHTHSCTHVHSYTQDSIFSSTSPHPISPLERGYMTSSPPTHSPTSKGNSTSHASQGISESVSLTLSLLHR